MINDESKRVLSIDSYEMVKEDGWVIKKAQLARCQNASICTDLFDGHIYFCKNYIMEVFLKNLEKQATFNWKDDFIPLIINNQANTSIIAQVRQIEEKQKVPNYHKKTEEIKIFAYIKDDIFIRRVNNLKDYTAANLEFIKPQENKLISEIFEPTKNNELSREHSQEDKSNQIEYISRPRLPQLS